MVVQKTIDNLKDRPKDERQAVAIGTASAVVAVLLVAWAFFFLKGVRETQMTPTSLIPPSDTSYAPVVQQGVGQNDIPANDQFGSPVTQQ